MVLSTFAISIFFIHKGRSYVREEFGFGLSKALKELKSKTLTEAKRKSLELQTTSSTSQKDDSQPIQDDKSIDQIKELNQLLKTQNAKIEVVEDKQSKQNERINGLFMEIMNIQKMFM
jgi:hypothetical protein|tara:strand:- start:460 stop:813 length:354 start_codon:yes stop_codon:yes gene_type:complete